MRHADIETGTFLQSANESSTLMLFIIYENNHSMPPSILHEYSLLLVESGHNWYSYTIQFMSAVLSSHAVCESSIQCNSYLCIKLFFSDFFLKKKI